MSRFNVVLFQPEIPQNTGNIGRTCVAAEARLWLVRPLGFRMDDRRMRRAGLDYWPHLEWQVVDDWQALADQVPVERMWFFSRFGQRAYTSVTYRPEDFLIFGSETQGLPDSLLQQHADRVLRIPTSPQVRSLNLSNAVAIVLFEALRQGNELS